MTWIEALIIAIVEGITEFLPISSTGHMIITQQLLGIPESDFIKLFIVNIQFGAILSVVLLYWKRFIKSIQFYISLFIAFIPAAIFGLLFSDAIDSMLENIYVVATTLILGGVVLIFVDKWFAKNEVEGDSTPEPPKNKSALIIGLFQVIAMIPGVSRSAATIIGGMTQKFTRKKAAEFSFFLAVPTMFAASAYKLLKTYKDIKPDDIDILVFGNIVAFIVAILAIKFFINFLTKYGFKIFGYYRIIVGSIILIMLSMGYNLTIV